MKIALHILASIAGAILSAVPGGIVGFLLGMLLMSHLHANRLRGADLAVILMYALAFVFGILGFTFCLAWLGKWRNQDSNQPTTPA